MRCCTNVPMVPPAKIERPSRPIAPPKPIVSIDARTPPGPVRGVEVVVRVVERLEPARRRGPATAGTPGSAASSAVSTRPTPGPTTTSQSGQSRTQSRRSVVSDLAAGDGEAGRPRRRRRDATTTSRERWAKSRSRSGRRLIGAVTSWGAGAVRRWRTRASACATGPRACASARWRRGRRRRAGPRSNPRRACRP